MPINLKELYRVRSFTYDPKNPTSKLYYKPNEHRIRFNLATVMDNKDPDNMCRVKLQIASFGNETLTDWVPVARPFAGSQMGALSIPETNDTVVVAFLSDNVHTPVVLGQIYDKGKNMAQPLSENPENNIKKFKSKSGMEIVLNDKQGEEQIVLRTKDDKMILNLTKAGGVTIKNEEGKVQISCDSFVMESGKDATFKIEKSAKFEAKSIDLKSSKGIAVKSSGNVVVKGSKIKLKGSSGVTAEMKMIAVKQDMIVGVDNHQVKIPTQSGPQPGPVLPHPFVGDLKDKLSKDVFVNNKAAATKGSKGKTKVHMPMPPGIMFNKQPDKIGIVDKGCIDSVKINGKAAAVLMAECKTCNDPGPTAMMPAKILAFGTAISFPANMLGLDASKYATSNGNVQVNSRNMGAGAGAGSGNRQLSNPQWEKTACSFNDKVKLSVDIQSYPNASVIFTVWKQGANMQTEAPEATLRATSNNGKAEVEWKYSYQIDPNNPLTAKPKFIFTADSHGCTQIQSSAASEWGSKIDIKCVDAYDNIIKGIKYKLKLAGTTHTVGDDGMILHESCIPGEEVLFDFEEGGDDSNVNNNTQNPDGSSDTSSSSSQSNKKKKDKKKDKEDDKEKKDFIEINLVDEETGEPYPNEKYEVYDSNGKKITEGKLDKNGYAKVKDLESGANYDVIFPKLIESNFSDQDGDDDSSDSNTKSKK